MASYFPQCWVTIQVVIEGDAGGPRTIQSIPAKSATVTSNGYKEADKFQLTFNAKVFPVHPSLIRACAVEIYMFDAGAVDVRDRLETFSTDENLQIAGLADMATLSLSDDGRLFSFEGQDYTALIQGKIWPPGKRVPVGGQIDDVVQQLVDEASQAAEHGRHLTVEYRAGGDIVLGKTAATVTHKVVKPKKRVGQGGAKGHKRGIPVKADSTYWDVIYRLCLSHGLIVYVEGTTVVISEPQTLTDEMLGKAVRLVYGRNLRELEIERHIGNLVTPQIIATSFGPPALEAKWPPNDQLGKQAVNAQGKVTGLGTSKTEALRVTAPARIRDKDELQDFARAFYEVKSRAEATAKFQTKHLRDLDSNNLLAVRAGAPLRLEFDAFRTEGLEQLTTAQRFARLLELDYAPQVAELIADNYDLLTEAFNVPLYCRQAEKQWDEAQGLALSFEGINYVDVERDDVRD